MAVGGTGVAVAVGGGVRVGAAVGAAVSCAMAAGVEASAAVSLTALQATRTNNRKVSTQKASPLLDIRTFTLDLHFEPYLAGMSFAGRSFLDRELSMAVVAEGRVLGGAAAAE